MKKVLIVFALMSALQFNTVNAQKNFTVNGVNIPRTIEFKGTTLTLNGVGQRSKFFTDLYIQALYLTKFSQDANQILESGNEMAVSLHITSGLISSKKLSKALAKGMEKSVGESGVLKFAKELQELEIKHPEWSKNATIYEVNVRQFTPEGTFKADLMTVAAPLNVMPPAGVIVCD